LQCPEATRLRIYNTLAISTILYGSKTWTLQKHTHKPITAAEMRFLTKTANYTLFDHKRNQDIIKELRIEPVLEKINNYKHK
jgi:hypothetical protein